MAPGTFRSAVFIAAALLSAAGCGSRVEDEAARGLGRAAFAGPVRALSPSPDGAWLAFLDGCRDVKAQFLPPGTARCDLRVVAGGGGAAPTVAAGVTTLPQGVSWSPDGKSLAALSDYDHASASGTLVLWRGGEARRLADGVGFHGFGAHGELGWIAGGRLFVLLPGEASARAVEGAEQVASFDVSPVGDPRCAGGATDRVRLAVRRSYAAGGQLLAAPCDLARAGVLERGQVGDYAFARGSPALAYTVQGKDGATLRLVETASGAVGAPLGQRVQAFAFGPDGRTLAFLADVVPGKQGDLEVAGPGGKPALLAKEVGEFRWARDALRLAWLEKYDPRVRAGTLGVGGPGLAPRTLARNVSDLELSPDGERVAFLQHTTRGGYSVDLGLARAGAPAGTPPVMLGQGVFGFAFSPDGRWLYYRTRCVRNAEACDLERVPAAGLASGQKPEPVAQGIKSFEFDPRDPGRLLVTWQRMDLVALDLGVWKDGKLERVDRGAQPGSARFLGPDSRRLAYVVAEPKRAGVYVAEVGR